MTIKGHFPTFSMPCCLMIHRELKSSNSLLSLINIQLERSQFIETSSRVFTRLITGDCSEEMFSQKCFNWVMQYPQYRETIHFG